LSCFCPPDCLLCEALKSCLSVARALRLFSRPTRFSFRFRCLSSLLSGLDEKSRLSQRNILTVREGQVGLRDVLPALRWGKGVRLGFSRRSRGFIGDVVSRESAMPCWVSHLPSSSPPLGSSPTLWIGGSDHASVQFRRCEPRGDNRNAEKSHGCKTRSATD